MKSYFLYALLACISLSVFAQKPQSEWKLNKTEDGIKIYTRKVEGESLKEYKATMTIDADAEAVVALMRDVPSNIKWMDKIRSAKLLKRIDENEFIYYAEVDAPWPVADRDMIIHVKIEKTAKGYLLHMSNAADYLPLKKSFVRIPRFRAQWTLIAKPNGQLEITQQGLSAAGGDIPDWMANSAVVDSPFNSMLKMRSLLGKR